MKKFACIICGRDKQGAVICAPCRQANIRLLRFNTVMETYIVMMLPKYWKELKQEIDKRLPK